MGSCLSKDRNAWRDENNSRRRHRSRSHRHRAGDANIPLDQRPHTPLKRPRWVHDQAKHGPPPSITSLQRQREDFWFTRVSGRPEIWETIRSVCEMLMEDDSDQQLATAREMLAAAEITTPTGNFENGAWDMMGNRYKVPRHIVSNPLNVGKASPPRTSIDSQESVDSSKSSMSGRQGASASGGNYVETVAHTSMFRIQDSDNSWDLEIEFWTDEKVKKIVKRIIVAVGLSPENHKGKMMMDGKVFDMKKKLMDQGQPPWVKGRIIQVFIRNTDATDPLSSPSPPMSSILPVPFPPPPGANPAAQQAGAVQERAGVSQPSEENQIPKPMRDTQGPTPSEENQNPQPTSKGV